MDGGAIDIVTVIMKREKEFATENAMITAIAILEAGRENLAKAVAERCQAQIGASIAPLGHPLSDLIRFGTPSVGVHDGR